MKGLFTALIIISLICFSSCSLQTPQTDAAEPQSTPTDPTTLQTEPIELPSATSAANEKTPDRTKIDGDALTDLRALFGDWNSWYCRATTSEYGNPKEIDLYELFYVGDGSFHTPTDDEREFLIQAKAEQLNIDKAEVELLDVSVISASSAEYILDKFFGISLEETTHNGVDKLIYWKDADSYYTIHGDTNLTYVQITDAYLQEDGSIDVYYFQYLPPIDNTDEPSHIMKLLPTDSGAYYVYSNLPISA